MKASDLFVRCLEEEAIPFLIGVPGEENADMMLSLEGSSIDIYITRHEQGAVFAASTYGKLTGQPAGCIGTLGPGATNMVTGIADANMDHAPLLAITGQGSTDRLHKESHQIMDAIAMFDPVTKWATSIRTAESIPEVIRKSIRLARGEKPGAVLVELPEDIAKRDSDAKPLTPRRYRRPTPNADALQAAADMLASADRPMILSGNGGIRTRASDEIRSLAEAFGLPVVTTFMGKGAVSMDSEHCLFTVGIQQRDEIAQELIEADTVLAIGYDLVEYPPRNWVGPRTRIIHLDFTPAEIDTSYHPEVELVGDVAAGLIELRRLLESKRGPNRHANRLAQVRQSMLEEFAEHANDDTKGVIKPQKLLWDTRQALGPSDVVLSGVGAHKMWIGRHYQCIEPNTCLIPNGFCSMGPSSAWLIGAKLARPDHHCVAICGDGDFLMNVQEMETIARMKLDVVAIVWEDQAYALLSGNNKPSLVGHTDLSFGIRTWIGLGEAFGWRSERVENSTEFLPALKRSLDHPGPSLLVARVDYRENMKLTERLGQQVCRI